MSRLYVSGPMRGLPENNYPAFHSTSDILRAMGHDVLNPAESFEGNQTLDRTVYLRHDIHLVLAADGVVVLDDWDQSPGAKLEVACAWAVGIPVYELVYHLGIPILDELDCSSVYISRENQYIQKRPLIGLLGYARAGKDALASTLVENGWTRVAFADPLKAIATDIGWDGQKDETGRKLLQDLGVAVRDYLHSDAWVIAAEEHIDLLETPVVITDVRFPNELQMIRRRRGKLVRVVRPGTGPANEHISEHAVADVEVDAELLNDGSLEDLAQRGLDLVQGFWPEDPVHSYIAELKEKSRSA